MALMIVVVGETGLHLFTSRMPTPALRHIYSPTASEFAEGRSWLSMLARRRTSRLHNSTFQVSYSVLPRK